MILEKAPAKINLSLDVLKKREDHYHELDMVMTTIDLFDVLQFEVLSEDKIILTCNKPYVPTDERNLCYQVIREMKKAFNIQAGVKVAIKKNIPVAAGLAGGSSDAAATIRAMNLLFNLNLSLEQMLSIGEKIGSDVPFCVYNKTAQAKGRGEIIVPLPKVPHFWVVIAKPRFGVSTKEVFQNVNLDAISHPNVPAMIEAIKHQDYQQIINNLGNALESVTFKLYPEVEALKNKLLQLDVDAVLMSGSGPTVFALTEKERKAKQVVQQLDQRVYECYAVRVLG